MGNPKFQIFIGLDKQFYFRLRAKNGEIVLSSEGYTSRAGCENGVSAVKENAPKEERYHRHTSQDEQYYFVLVAANGEVIGTSEMYTTRQNRDNGIEVIKSIAPAAPIEMTA